MNDSPKVSSDTEIISRLASLESVVLGAGDDEGIDLRVQFAALWRGKWIILMFTSVFAAFSVMLALWLPNEYKATAVLVPAATSSSSAALSRVSGQLGGLAALAGVSLGGQGGDDKTTAAIELVKSWGFLEKFIRDNRLDVEVFAARGWDRSGNRLIIDADLYDVKSQKWVRKYNPSAGQTVQPNGWELYKKLSERLSISQDKKTGFVTFSVEYYSPLLAKEWLDKLIVAINAQLQNQDRQEASKSIQYLRSQMEQTKLTEMQNVFSRLIEEQTKNLMLTEVGDEYVLRTLSPAMVPEEKSKPRRAIICVAGAVLGSVLGVVVVLLLAAMRRSNA